MNIVGMVVDAAGGPAAGVSIKVQGFIAARVIEPVERGEHGGPRRPVIGDVHVATEEVVVQTDAAGRFSVSVPTPAIDADVGRIQGRKTFGAMARALGPAGNVIAEATVDGQVRPEVELSLALPVPPAAFEQVAVGHERQLRAGETWRLPAVFPVGAGPLEVSAFTLKRTIERADETGTGHPVIAWEPDLPAVIHVAPVEGTGAQASGEGELRVDVGADDGGGRRAWNISITNPSTRPARVTYQARFVSRHPIVTRRVSYADLNRSISRLTQLGPHDPGEPPIKFVLADPVRVVVREDWQVFFESLKLLDPPSIVSIRGGEATVDVQIRTVDDDVALVMRFLWNVPKVGASIPALLDVEATNLPITLTFRLGIERQQIVYRCEGHTRLDVDVDLPLIEVAFPIFGSWLASKAGDVATNIARNLVRIDVPAALDAHRFEFGRIISDVFAGRDRKILSIAPDQDGIVWRFVDDERDPLPTLPPEVASPALLTKVDHIVVLMMENRSFDHMLGYLTRDKERTEVDGLAPVDTRGNSPHWNPLGNEQIEAHRLRGTKVPVDVDPCHEVACTAAQIGAGRKMDGFLASFARRLAEHPRAAAKADDVIGYFGAEQVWAYDAIAEHFAICDRWFASHPGPTWPNRYFLIAGKLGPSTDGGPDVDMTGGPTPIALDTIFDELTRRGVSWTYFEHDIGFLRKVEQYSLDFDRIVDIDDPERGFFARAARGDLPSVTFIDPNFVDFRDGRTANDDHPPADVAPGQLLVARIYNALRASPQWGKALFVVTYDEHGGFYDHVPPPAAPAPHGSFATLGVRVPGLVMSPWIPPRHVEHALLDHTVIAKTIFRRFSPESIPSLSERFVAAPDLGVMLTLDAPRGDALPEIPIPGTIAPAAREAPAPIDEADVFRRSLIGLRAAVDARRPRR